MGWLVVKKEVVTSSDEEGGGRNGEGEGVKDRARMPCRGVSDMDNKLVDHYLKRTGVGGGGGQSVYVISGQWFGKKFKNLTHAQKDEAEATQRAEWR